MLRAALTRGRFFIAINWHIQRVLRIDMECVLKTKTTMDERVLAIAEPVAKDLGFGIVRVRVMAGKRATLQVMAERLSDGTMGVDDCATLSRELSSVFEVEDPIDGAYVLEVSSAGLDRPLTDIEHFDRYQGYLARLELDRLVEGRKRFRGILAGVDGDQVEINLDGEGDTALIPFDWISEAKLLITDELIEKGQKAKEQAQKEQQEAASAPTE